MMSQSVLELPSLRRHASHTARDIAARGTRPSEVGLRRPPKPPASACAVLYPLNPAAQSMLCFVPPNPGMCDRISHTTRCTAFCSRNRSQRKNTTWNAQNKDLVKIGRSQQELPPTQRGGRIDPCKSRVPQSNPRVDCVFQDHIRAVCGGQRSVFVLCWRIWILLENNSVL